MPEKNGKKLLKMSDLIQRTGVQRQTIHFYINKGLLPPPLKTGKNMAYYEESFVERIRLIKELQLKRFLPLSVIKEILSQAEGELSISDLNVIKIGGEGLLKLEELKSAREPESLAHLSNRTGLPSEEIEEMERWELISSVRNEHGEKMYRDGDIRIVEAFAAIRKGGLTKERGFGVDLFRLHADFINMLAIEEVKIFGRKFSENFPQDASALLPKFAENAIENINTFINHVRRKKILEIVRAFSQRNGEKRGLQAGGQEIQNQ